MNDVPRICITTHFDERFATLGNMCVASIRKYAARHHHSFEIVCDVTSDRHPSWNKLLVIRKLFDKGYDFVFWIDADALFSSFETDIRAEIEQGKDLYLFRHPFPDGTMPNFGVFLIRNSAWSKEIIETLWNMKQYERHIWWENAAFDDLFGLIGALPPEHRKRFCLKYAQPNEAALHKVKWLDERWNYGVIKATRRFKKYKGLNFWLSCFLELVRNDHAVIKHYPGTQCPMRLFALSIAAYRAELISFFMLCKNLLVAGIMNLRPLHRAKRIAGMLPAAVCDAFGWPIPKRQFLPFILRVRGLDGEGVEIGVGEGVYSHAILRHSDLRLLHSIDPWKKTDDDIYRDIYNDSTQSIEGRYLHTASLLGAFICRNNIMRMTSKEAAEFFDDGSLDFAYIDANHDYRACKEDLNLWWPKVRRGGIFAGHDYLNGELPSGRYGVKKAVDEFMAEAGQAFSVTPEAWPTWYAVKK